MQDKLKVNQEEIVKILKDLKKEMIEKGDQKKIEESVKLMRLEDIQPIIQFYKDNPEELRHEDNKTVFRIFEEEIQRRSNI